MQLLRLGIDLKVSRQFFNRREAKQKPSHLERAIIYLFISTLLTTYVQLQGEVIGSWRCVVPLWLVVSHHFVLRQSFRNRFVMCAIATYHYSMEPLRTSEIPVVGVGRDLNSGSPDLQPCSLSSRSWYPSSWMENKNWTSSLLSTFHVTTVILNLRLFFSIPKVKRVFQGFWGTREHWPNIELNNGTWTYFGGTGKQNFTN